MKFDFVYYNRQNNLINTILIIIIGKMALFGQ